MQAIILVLVFISVKLYQAKDFSEYYNRIHLLVLTACVASGLYNISYFFTIFVLTYYVMAVVLQLMSIKIKYKLTSFILLCLLLVKLAMF